jgi:hypothetical protein
MKGKRTMKRDSDFELIDGGKHLGARLIRIVEQDGVFPDADKVYGVFPPRPTCGRQHLDR